MRALDEIQMRRWAGVSDLDAMSVSEVRVCRLVAHPRRLIDRRSRNELNARSQRRAGSGRRLAFRGHQEARILAFWAANSSSVRIPWSMRIWPICRLACGLVGEFIRLES